MTAPARASGIHGRLRILVIDDEPGPLADAEAALWAHRVESCSGPEDGLLRLCTGEEIDVIVVDVQMPWVNGVEFYDLLCALAPRYANRVVFASGARLDAVVLDAIARVDTGWVEKPFDADALEAQVQLRASERGRPAASLRAN
ncbi:MAG: response regulator [Deltaproteobacteria bacterium]